METLKLTQSIQVTEALKRQAHHIAPSVISVGLRTELQIDLSTMNHSTLSSSCAVHCDVSFMSVLS